MCPSLIEATLKCNYFFQYNFFICSFLQILINKKKTTNTFFLFYCVSFTAVLNSALRHHWYGHNKFLFHYCKTSETLNRKHMFSLTHTPIHTHTHSHTHTPLFSLKLRSVDYAYFNKVSNVLCYTCFVLFVSGYTLKRKCQ